MRQCRKWDLMRAPAALVLAVLVGAFASPRSADAASPSDWEVEVAGQTQAPSQPPPPAPVAVDAEVTVIHATNNADAGIDPRIGKIPNLGSYKSYQLLSQSNMTIKKAPT